MVASYSVFWYTHPFWHSVVSLSPYSLMALMSQSTGTNIWHLLNVPSSCLGTVRFSCSFLVRFGSARRIQSVLQCLSGSDWIKIKLENKIGSKAFGKVNPSRISFWKKPKSPMVLRISPKSTIADNLLDKCRWTVKFRRRGKCLTHWLYSVTHFTGQK